MMASDPKLKAEIGPDGLAREAPVIAYTEKVIFSKLLISMYVWFRFDWLIANLCCLWKPDNRGRTTSVEEVSIWFWNFVWSIWIFYLRMNVVCILRSEILSMLHSSPCDPSLLENTGVSLFKNWMLVFFLLLNERERASFVSQIHWGELFKDKGCRKGIWKPHLGDETHCWS